MTRHVTPATPPNPVPSPHYSIELVKGNEQNYLCFRVISWGMLCLSGAVPRCRAEAGGGWTGARQWRTPHRGDIEASPLPPNARRGHSAGVSKGQRESPFRDAPGAPTTVMLYAVLGYIREAPLVNAAALTRLERNPL